MTKYSVYILLHYDQMEVIYKYLSDNEPDSFAISELFPLASLTVAAIQEFIADS